MASVIIARTYGADIIGIVAVINSFLLLATTITILGTDTSILRLLPEHMVKYSATSAFKVYRKIIFLAIGSSIIICILFFLFSNHVASIFFHKPNLSYFIALASFFVVFKSLAQLNTMALRGIKLIRLFALMQVFPQGFNLFFLFALPLLISSQNIPVYALLFSLSLTAIIGWGFVEYNFNHQKQQFDVVCSINVKKILSISFPMLTTSTMAFIMGQTGVLLLSMFRTETEVGYYDISVKLATLTSFILGAVNSIAAPKFSELFHSGKIEELFHIAKKSTKLIFWSTTPLLLGLLLLGKFFLIIFFGQNFSASYPPLVILLFGQFLNSISGSTGFFMNMTGNERVFKNIMLISAAFNILLSIILIPKMGAIGAAIASMFCLVFWNSTILIYMKINFGKTTGYIPFC